MIRRGKHMAPQYLRNYSLMYHVLSLYRPVSSWNKLTLLMVNPGIDYTNEKPNKTHVRLFIYIQYRMLLLKVINMEKDQI